VMHEEQVGTRLDGQSHRDACGIHRGGDSRHAPAILDLKPVLRSVPVLEPVRLQQAIALEHNRSERSLRHAAMLTRIRRLVKRPDLSHYTLNRMALLLVLVTFEVIQERATGQVQDADQLEERGTAARLLGTGLRVEVQILERVGGK